MEFVDSSARDQLYATEKGVWISGADFVNSVEGFQRVEAESTSGRDQLMLASALAALATPDEHGCWIIDEHDFEIVARGFEVFEAARE